MATWELDVTGVAGHSGMTQNCVNALELAMATSAHSSSGSRSISRRTPTRLAGAFSRLRRSRRPCIEVDNNKINKIPGSATMRGDIRLTPFYDMQEAIDGARALRRGARPRCIESGRRCRVAFRGSRTVDGRRGSVKLTPRGATWRAIACDLDSPGLERLDARPPQRRARQPPHRYSMTGSLPLVRDLQRAGFDVQITGFGHGRLLSRAQRARGARALPAGLRDPARARGRVSA